MSATVFDHLGATLASRAGAPAVVAGSESWSFQELAERSERAARGLAALGAAPGERVVLCMSKSLGLVAQLLGALRAGAIAVPVHPSLRPAQIAHVVQDCGARLVLVDAPLARALATYGDFGVGARVALGRPSGGRDSADAPPCVETAALAAGERAASLPAPRPDDAAAILYTSGSTGMPKGIVISHGALARGAETVAGYLGTRPEDRIAGVLSLAFDYGLNQLWQALLTGASLHLHDLAFARDFFRLVARQRLTVLPLMPVFLARLFDPRLPGREESLDLSPVRCITSTGGVVTERMLADLRAAFPRADVVLMYGLTEAFRSTYLPPRELARRPDSIGRAIPGVEIHVLDDSGRECPPEVAGELVHRGGAIARGYWNAPEATAKRFRRLDAFPGETVVFSGDLVRRDAEGFLYFVGRKDEMIKSHGFRISPTEIERAALSHPGVGEAVAFGVVNHAVGQDVGLVYTSRSGAAVSRAELRLCLERVLAPHMLPRHFVQVDALPRTGSGGKVDRARARADALLALLRSARAESAEAAEAGSP